MGGPISERLGFVVLRQKCYGRKAKIGLSIARKITNSFQNQNFM